MSQYGPSEPPRAATAWVLAALVGAITFTAFTGYAFLTPAVYRTSALIEVWSASDNGVSKLEPLEASRRLHEAVLDSAVLERLAEERAPGASAETKSQLARVIESALQIDTVDARTFTLSFRDSERARAERGCNWLAERVVERAPSVLAPDTSAEDRSLDVERRRRAAAVQAFLAAHPGLGTASGDAPLPSASANPGESNAALRAQLQQLLADLAKAKDASASAASEKPALQARVVAPAHASFWPVEPDRPRLLLVGFLAALGSAALAAFLGKRRAADFSESTPPPGVSSNPPSQTSSYPPYGSSYPPAVNHSSHPPGTTISSYPPPPPPPPPDAQQVSSYPPAASTSSNPPPSLGQPIIPARVVSPPPPAPPVEPTTRGSDPVPGARASGRGRLSSHNEGDRITPVSAYPPPVSSSQSDRPLRAALEVNAGVPATEKRGSAPAAGIPRGQSARTTHVLGSPIPPIIAPGSRRLPSVGSGEQAASAPVSTTGYSYVSSAPPQAGPSSHPRGAPPQVPLLSALDHVIANGPSGPSTRRFVTSPPPGKDASVVSLQRAPAGWRADLSLLPESRRNLCDEIYPFAVEGCCVVGVLGGADTAEAKSRLAAELALSLAESGHARVLLLEGDLERCEVRRFLRVEMPLSSGFSAQMRARISGGSERPWVVVECSSSMHVLADGNEATPELIFSRTFEECLRELRRYYDFVVIDGPLISNANACRAVHDVVDRVVFSHGRFGPSELAEATALLPNKRISVVPAFG